MIRRVAGGVTGRVGELVDVLAVGATVSLLATRPRHWPRTTRDVLARQLLFTGVQALGLVAALAAIVGTSVVLQAELWLNRVGQRALLGPLLVVLVVREVAPVLANLVVILRSAGAVTAEMANMKLSGEVGLLDAQGLDPLLYLVMPRTVAMVVAASSLAVAFVVVSLASGYVAGAVLGTSGVGGPGEFAGGLFRAVGPVDAVNLVVKSVVPAGVTAVICCCEGLAVEGGTTAVPRATSRGLERSVVALFIVSAGVSILTYL